MEDNFEHHIKGLMNDPPDFPFDENLWKDVEARMNNQKEKKPILSFVGRLPLFLLALITTGLAGYFYVNQNKAIARIAEVEQQLERKNEINTKSEIERRVTVIYDTIYNNIVVDQVQKQKIAHHTKNRKLGQLYFSKFVSDFGGGLRNDFLNDSDRINFRVNRQFENRDRLYWSYFNDEQRYSTAPKLGLLQHIITKPEAHILEGEELQQLEDLKSKFNWNHALARISPRRIPLLQNISYLDRLPPVKIANHKKKKRIVFYLHQLRPTRFALSGTTGTFVSLNLGGSGFNLRGSAIAEVGMGKRFSLTVGTEYFSNDFNKKIDPDELEPLIGFPDLPPDNAEDVLMNIQGDFDYLQIPFGIKYIVFPRRYFYPYIGAGLISAKSSKSRLEYDFISSIGNDYSISRGNLLPSTFEISAFYSTLGFEIQMNRNWSLILEGGSQFNLKKGRYKYENLALLKFNTGVQYEF